MATLWRPKFPPPLCPIDWAVGSGCGRIKKLRLITSPRYPYGHFSPASGHHMTSQPSYILLAVRKTN